MAQTSPDSIVVTVLGKNRPGIIARVAGILADEGVDIRDVTQSIVDDMFTMTMLASFVEPGHDLAPVQERLTALGKELELTITAQREDVFNFMHRL